MHALVSIHDVMPDTLPRVERIIERLPRPCLDHLVLLVVPGLDWQAPQIERLRSWQEDGLLLAGHGWQHRSQKPADLYHRLHSALISRQAAEHLSLDEAGIVALMVRNAGWFIDQDLAVPDLYVPPARALGRIRRSALQNLPFRYLETTRGFHDLETGRSLTLPLCGFECDNVFRELTLRPWNRLQTLLAGPRRPLRIALHPDDLELRLADQLEQILRAVSRTHHYAELMTQGD